MQIHPLIVERTLNAPAEQIWQALTDLSQIKKWYFDLDSFEARVGFVFEFYGAKDDTKYLHHCKITEVIPDRKLSYTWQYQDFQGTSEVSFELFPHDDATLVRITHSGLGSFPKDNPDFALSSFIAGWTHILGVSLSAFVEEEK